MHVVDFNYNQDLFKLGMLEEINIVWFSFQFITNKN